MPDGSGFLGASASVANAGLENAYRNSPIQQMLNRAKTQEALGQAGLTRSETQKTEQDIATQARLQANPLFGGGVSGATVPHQGTGQIDEAATLKAQGQALIATGNPAYMERGTSLISQAGLMQQRQQEIVKDKISQVETLHKMNPEAAFDAWNKDSQLVQISGGPISPPKGGSGAIKVDGQTIGYQAQLPDGKWVHFNVPKGSGTETERIARGFFHAGLKASGISDREPSEGEIAEAMLTIKREMKLDSPDREEQIIRETKGKATAAAGVKEAEAAKPVTFSPQMNKGINGLIGDITDLRLGPSTAMDKFVQKMGGQNSGAIRLEIESRIKDKYPNFDITKADAYAQQEKRPDLIRSQENVTSVIQSAEMVKKLIPALENGDVKVINEVNQWWQTHMGSPAPTNWRTAAVAMGQEFNRAYSDSVVNPEGRFNKEIANLAVSNSPKQLIGSLDTNLSLTRIRGQAIDRMRHPYTKEEILGIEPAKGSGSKDQGPKTIKRTGIHNGKKVVEYSDGSIEYAD